MEFCGKSWYQYIYSILAAGDVGTFACFRRVSCDIDMIYSKANKNGERDAVRAGMVDGRIITY